MAVAIGDKAPDFTLKDQYKRTITLQDYRGTPVVLVFFPLAFSSVCTAEVCNFSSALPDYTDIEAQVLGISVDSPYVLKEFSDKNCVLFPLLSDFNKEVIRAYDVVQEDMAGLHEVAKRAVFVIDSNGTVSWKWISRDPKQEPDYEEVLRAVEDLAAAEII